MKHLPYIISALFSLPLVPLVTAAEWKPTPISPSSGPLMSFLNGLHRESNFLAITLSGGERIKLDDATGSTIRLSP